MFLLVNCPKCGDYMLANDRHASVGCPKCGKRSPLYGLRVLRKAKDPRDATEMLQKYKMERAKPESVDLR